jgi:DNA repair protein RecN (Recombination protein N)
MLKSLKIRNYALIDALDLEWHDGLTAMTGETGSGKSIVLGALGLLLGGRSDASSIRTGADRCTVEGVFTAANSIGDWLAENELENWDDLIVRREFSKQGRGRVFINDTPVKLHTLQELGNRLVDLHGQDSVKLLLQREFQLAWIDANADHADAIAQYRVAYEAFKSAQIQLAELELKRSQPQTDLDYIHYQLNELTSLRLADQDWSGLMEEREMLEHGEAIREALAAAFDSLSDNDAGNGALDRLQHAAKQLDQLSGYSAKFIPLQERLQSLRIELKDLVLELESAAEEAEANPQRLDQLNALHHDLQRMLHKHHASDVDELRRLEASLTEQLDEAANIDEAYAVAQRDLASKRNVVVAVGEQLMGSRQRVAEELAAGIQEKLERLSMPGAALSFEWERMQEPDVHGIESVTIAFSANPGHPALPLQKVASGGEKSRLMLAFKATGKGSNALPTIVLDEIDTGVSGKVAEEMARLMHDMATQQQVIAVTHLPQVAAAASRQLKVSKATQGATTRTEVVELDAEARVLEIASMLSGSTVTDAAVANAASLLASK